MKKPQILVRVFLVALIFLSSQKIVFGQWSNTTDNYTTGKLGIGINSNTPTTQLEVSGTGTGLFRNVNYSTNGHIQGAVNIFKNNENGIVNTVLNLGNYYNSNSSNNSILAIDFRAGDGNGMYGGTTSPAGRIKVQTAWVDPYMDFDLAGNTIVKLQKNGNVGIGSLPPVCQLDVSGTGTGLFRNVNYSTTGYIPGAVNIFRNNENGVVNTVLNLGNYFNSNSSNNSILAIDFRAGDGNGIYGGATNPAGRIKVQTAWVDPYMDFDLGGKTVMKLLKNGSVGIGTVNTGSFQLAVEGKIGAREINVTSANPWPDYVFLPTHSLKPLSEVESFIKENKHLPEIPSAKEVEANGINLGEMDALLLKKIEEMTLYMIEINKKMQDVTVELEVLKLENQQLKSK